jgi:hypothetical protein
MTAEELKKAALDYCSQPRRLRRTNLYLIQAGQDGPIKIGLAVSVKKRLKQLQTGNHNRLKIVGIVRNCKPELETSVHRELHNFRINGEWFSGDILKNKMELKNIVECYHFPPNEWPTKGLEFIKKV